MCRDDAYHRKAFEIRLSNFNPISFLPLKISTRTETFSLTSKENWYWRRSSKHWTLFLMYAMHGLNKIYIIIGWTHLNCFWQAIVVAEYVCWVRRHICCVLHCIRRFKFRIWFHEVLARQVELIRYLSYGSGYTYTAAFRGCSIRNWNTPYKRINFRTTATTILCYFIEMKRKQWGQ